MKKVLYFSSLAAIGLSLLSCSSEEINDLNNDKVNNHSSAYAVPLEDAIEKADFFIQQLEQGENTRAKERKVCSVERLGIQTRSGDNKAGCYIINYGEDDGFAIISTENRTVPVYAIATEGHFSTQDTINNQILKEYLEYINLGIIIDPVLPEPKVKDVETAPGIIEHVKPLVCKVARSWTQKSHNKYVRSKCNNDSTPVGCTILSTVQIMSCLEWPECILILDKNGQITESYSFNWKAINNGNKAYDDELARLMEILGRPSFYNVKYDVTGSSAWIESTPIVFTKLGYVNSGNVKMKYGFDENIIAQLKYRRRPVQIVASGYNNVVDTITGDVSYKHVGAHAFVIDGYCVQKFPIESGLEKTYYHIVWGNGAKNDGYYYMNEDFFRRNAEFRFGSERAENLTEDWYPHGVVYGF